jgi:hypothetical protein
MTINGFGEYMRFRVAISLVKKSITLLLTTRTKSCLRMLVIVVTFGMGSLVIAQEQPPVDFSGVWSTNSIDVLDDPAWDTVGHFSCACTRETYELLMSLLNDPAQDGLSAVEIVTRMEAHTIEVIADRLTETGARVGQEFDLADDPAIQCNRFGAFRTILHADPIEITTFDDRIEIRGEDLTVERTVYLNVDGHPDAEEKTSAGHSIGWFEGNTLVVETTNVPAGMVDDQLSLHHSDQASSIERYTMNEAGSVLNTSFTLHDPVMLKEPLIIDRPRVLTPGVSLELAPCDVISGQF